jgi:hypothetical protein
MTPTTCTCPPGVYPNGLEEPCAYCREQLAALRDAEPCPKGDPDCETGDDGSCHDACRSPRGGLLAGLLVALTLATGAACKNTIVLPSEDTAELNAGGWWVVHLGLGYWCGVPQDGGAGTVRYETAESAIRVCYRIHDGWVPPW